MLHLSFRCWNQCAHRCHFDPDPTFNTDPDLDAIVWGSKAQLNHLNGTPTGVGFGVVFLCFLKSDLKELQEINLKIQLFHSNTQVGPVSGKIKGISLVFFVTFTGQVLIPPSSWKVSALSVACSCVNNICPLTVVLIHQKSRSPVQCSAQKTYSCRLAVFG